MSKQAMLIRALIAFLLLPALVQAGTGLAELPATQEDGPVTVFYPSSDPDRPMQRGPFTLNLALNGAPARGNGRLVILSHGSGGGAWPHSDLARQLAQAGFVVALPEHQGDNWKDMSKVGPPSWKLRPAEVSRAINAVGRDARFAPLLDLTRVGVFGMSAGGHTALTLAGGRWSPAQLRRHCEQHIDDDFQTCVGLATSLDGTVLDSVKKTVAMWLIRQRLADETWYHHEDSRVRAVVAEVPFAADFDLATLAHPSAPLGIVRAGQDPWLLARFHSDAILNACQSCERVADLPLAGHGSLLSPPPPGLSGLAAKLLADPKDFNRSQVPAAHAAITRFFSRHLLP